MRMLTDFCALAVSDECVHQLQFDLWIAGDTNSKNLAKFIEGIVQDLEKQPGIVDAQANYMDVCPIRGYRLEVRA